MEQAHHLREETSSAGLPSWGQHMGVQILVFIFHSLTSAFYWWIVWAQIMETSRFEFPETIHSFLLKRHLASLYSQISSTCNPFLFLSKITGKLVQALGEPWVDADRPHCLGAGLLRSANLRHDQTFSAHACTGGEGAGGQCTVMASPGFWEQHSVTKTCLF